MTLEADRMRDLRLTEEDVVTERAVILEERNQRTDNDPGALFSEQTRAAQYLNHPYGIPIIGWRHEMAKLSRQDALDFYRTFYAPNNAILVVAGDVTPDEVRRLAETHYGPLAPTDGPARASARPSRRNWPNAGSRFADARVAAALCDAHLSGAGAQSGRAGEGGGADHLAELLGGSGTTSVLSAGAAPSTTRRRPMSRPSMTALRWMSAPSALIMVPVPGVSLDEAEAAMDAVMAKFLQDGVDPAAFERIKTQIRAAQIYAKDDVDGLARRLWRGAGRRPDRRRCAGLAGHPAGGDAGGGDGRGARGAGQAECRDRPSG